MESATQMKLNPSFLSDEVGFHHEVISSTKGGFIPSVRTDLVEKNPLLSTDKRGFFSGAADEARTRYLHLGKVALYQMSYSRISCNAGNYNKPCPRCQDVILKK